MKFLMVAAVALMLSGCDQTMSRQFGGTTTINLPCGEKYINASWKENNLWYATHPATAGEMFYTIVYRESSIVGILEGKVMFYEKAC